jgi:hypothetical protein
MAKKLSREEILDLVEMVMDHCFIDPIGDPDRTHRYAIACCTQ